MATALAVMDVDNMHIPLREDYVFDSTNRNWSENKEYNWLYLQMVKNAWNDALQARGHVFINDILDHMDLERTMSGQVMGWMQKFDDPIDFSIITVENTFYIRFVAAKFILPHLKP